LRFFATAFEDCTRGRRNTSAAISIAFNTVVSSASA
jgi:hypothetical protein